MTARAIKTALLAVAGLVGYLVLVSLLPPFWRQPLWAGLAGAALAAAGAWLWRRSWQRRHEVLSGPFLAFLVVFCTAFALVAGLEILDGQRELVGAGEPLPPAPGGFAGLGDWRYQFAPLAPPAPDLVVLARPSVKGRPLFESRQEIAGVVHQATKKGARGVALDFFLERESDENSVADAVLCQVIQAAVIAGVEIFLGYGHQVVDGEVGPGPLASKLRSCVEADRKGHLSGYFESDEKVRSIPLLLGGFEGREALSLRVARFLASPDRPLPSSGLARFTSPAGGIQVIDLASPPQVFTENQLAGRFVFFGSRSENDRFETPFGPLQGVEVHALTAHSLRSGATLRRPHPAWSFGLVFAACYGLALESARRGGWRRLLALAALATAALWILAAAAVAQLRWWLDVAPATAALWLLTGLLLVAGGTVPRLRRLLRRSSVAGDGAAGEYDFEVFLSHNSEDKPAVRELAWALDERGVRAWLDERELLPGDNWIDGIEDGLRSSASVAVLVGGDGLGPWEEEELRAGLTLAVDRGLRVIPVLLPGAPQCPALPLLLRNRTWVDLRDDPDDAGLDRLIWGITDKQPESVNRDPER